MSEGTSNTPFDHNKTRAMHVLEPATMPLSGVALIEASAGTGKTYTITSLYLRLVLGHGCEALSPERILVVTFTRAATEELRSRIRSRLRQAYLYLNGTGYDPLIEAIQPDLVDIDRAKQQLKDAQQLMDLASIYTIHGFAQRLLRQNSVHTGLNSEFELIMDESELLEQAVRDVWRSNVYPLSGVALQLVLDNWKTPDALLKDVRSLLYKQVHFHLGLSAPEIEPAFAQLNKAKQALAQAWHEQGEGFLHSILSHPLAHGVYSKSAPKKAHIIIAYLDNDISIKLKDASDALQAFTKAGLVKSVKKNGDPVTHGLSELCDNLMLAIDTFEQAKIYAVRVKRIELLNSLKSRLQQLKQQQQLLSTDDLLNHVNRALNGENQETLLQLIRQQYPVAMVDEFQDTDDEQYQVFKRIYNGEVGKVSLALLMIGDPKQAIYKFRGADIFTYIQAKQEVDAQYTLDTNYRSTKNMVDGVNQVFTQHEHPFIFDDSIPFLSVKASDNASSLMINGQEQPAISWVLIDDADIKNKAGLTSVCAENCAEQISQLLNGAKHKSVGLNQQPLAASDMAVLVRNRMQAAEIKHSLSVRGISCVYVGQQCIFDSEEAEALFALLQGIHGLSERQFRNAIAHPTWSLSLEQLKQFNSDEGAWEAQLEQLYVCHDIWLKQGVMAMVMHWLHSRELPNLWLTQLEGERRLTNMMHLAELLQHSSTEVQGMQGLVSWFTQQIMQAMGDAEQKQLRLESDANLVHIITIHKSKGLEYPVVFLPFNWEGKESKDELFFDEETQRTVCDLADDFKVQRIREGLAEEVRLLYVGLTRAASKCYVTIPEVLGNKTLDKYTQSSALHHVLFNTQDVDNRSSLLTTLVEQFPQSFAIEPLLSHVTEFHEERAQIQLQAKPFSGRIKRDWQMSSFSSLVRHLHAPVSPRFNLDDDEAKTQALTDEQVAQLDSQFRFPRGAHAGNFLHTLLEEIDFSALPDDLDTLIVSLLGRFGIDIQFAQSVIPWLHTILQAPMTQHRGDSMCLASLTPNLKKVEMEFYFPVAQLRAKDFNRLLAKYPCVSVTGHELDFSQLKGMLKGFIDLTFEWQGQFFILDYKSNHLGNDYSDYQLPALEGAMAEHRYDVQLVIYTLALHRLLSLRLPNYDYEQHIGGGYYLFLRGLSLQDTLTGQFFCRPPKALIEALDDLIKGESIDSVLKGDSVPMQGDLL